MKVSSVATVKLAAVIWQS